jgi:DNA-binding NarL/FixJ family response regulator
LEGSTVRILVVDDYEPWRRFVSTTLQKQLTLQVIGEALDGLEAVQKAEELHPDLIVLDIGLPSLNGIEVARQIRKLCPKSKILFASQGSSANVVQEALGTGARGYVVKTDARKELLTAVNAVLRGEYFVGKRFSGHDFFRGSDEAAPQDLRPNNPLAPLPPIMEIARRHGAGFYSDDRLFLDDVAQFIGAALKGGNAAIVVATESHRNSLLPRLQARGVDIAASIEQGSYIPVDAADMLSTFMINGMPDPARFVNLFGNLITTAAESAKGENSRVAVFGEAVNLLWAQGNAEAAIRVEKLANRLAETYDVDILCGYSLGSVQGGMDRHIFQRICEKHSAIYSR